MNKQDLKIFQQHFGDEKKFIMDGYYRLRAIGNKRYELAFLKAGPCGDTTVHPQITIEVTEQEIMPIKLLDMAVSPTLYLTKEEHEAELNDALKQLVQRFYHVLN